MPVYYMPIDAGFFHTQLAPALAASWKQRRFDPCKSLCAALLPRAEAFSARFHTGHDAPLILSVLSGLPFDRHFWQLLAWESFVFAASEIPEIEIAPDLLRTLLDPAAVDSDEHPREQYAVIDQAHYGTRYLCFAGKMYRPEHAGYNDTEDVVRLKDYLERLEPASWTLGELLDRISRNRSDLQEELELAREWFPALQELYRHTAARREILVCEIL
jgi:hypothetical protein